VFGIDKLRSDGTPLLWCIETLLGSIVRNFAQPESGHQSDLLVHRIQLDAADIAELSKRILAVRRPYLNLLGCEVRL
jgi:hypothetical protein